MQGLSPIRYLRKTTLVFLVVFLCFIAHRIFVSVGEYKRVKHERPVNDTKKNYSVVCRNIVGGSPFGVDSVFPAHTRLHYYTELPPLAWDVPNRKVMHIWFNGADTVQKVVCNISENTCESSIAPQLLGHGDWSVDAVEGRKLLSNSQFKVEPARE